jgi:hypothetical protein
VSKQYAAFIFRVDMRSCVSGRSVVAHLCFRTNSLKKFFLAVLQLAGTAVSLRYTCSCGMLLWLQGETDGWSAANIPYLLCDFDVGFTIIFKGYVS